MFQSLLYPLVSIPFLLMILTGVMMPSDGNHGLLNIKSLTFVLTCASLPFYLVAQQKTSLENLKILLFTLAAFCFLTFWSLIALGGSPSASESLVDQLKVFVITLSVTVISYYVIRENILTFSTFLKTIIYANFAYSLLKCTFVLLHVAKVTNILTSMEATGLRFMSLDMGTGMIRMQTSIDVLTPFLIFFVLKIKALDIKMSEWFRIPYLVVSLFSIFLSFSRVLMFIGFVSFALCWFTLKPRQIFKSVLLFLLVGIITITVIGPKTTETLVEQRFFSQNNRESDNDRSDQIEALVKEHQAYPFFGKGMGGYSPEVIRDSKLLHSYEVQWVAFLMQFGMLGIIGLLSALGIIFTEYFKGPLTRLRFSFLTLFFGWMLAGFTNPFLISLTSGIVYALFLLTGCYLNGHLKTDDVPTVA